MVYERERLKWNGWGWRDRGFDLRGRDREVWAFVREALELDALPETPAAPFEAISLPASRLDPALREGFVADTAADRVRDDDYERAFHALGRSYHDLIRLRAGQLPDAPDAVVYPESHDEVVAILARCRDAKVAVVPFGGGSSVVGGVEAERGDQHEALIALDTTRMRRLLDLDELSHTATFEAGVYGPELEEVLGARGYTLGHFPQSFEFSTLGGWIAARGAGQQSNRYGTAAEMLVAARLATPTGELKTGAFPSSAAGPDLDGLVAGSEGTLGVITEATVRVCPTPPARDFVSFLFRDWESGALAIQRIVQSELPVATLRLSDPDETHFFGAFRQILSPSALQAKVGSVLALGGFDAPCVLMVGYEGEAADVRRARRHTLGLATRLGGLYVGRGPGRSWYEQRFAMPYLRDPLMDHGVGVDTLETATTWSNLHHLYGKVREALRGAIGGPSLVLTHISHSYAEGASLYFTFIFARDLDDELGQWWAIKEAASKAISENGGTISHHHGVGRDHAPWLGAEKGALGLAILEAVKDRLDPHDILNPGKLSRGPGRNGSPLRT